MSLPDEMKLRLASMITVVAVAIAAAGLGHATLSFLGPISDEAIGLVPPGAAVYGTAFLDPSNDQKMALRDLLAHFPDASSSQEAEEFIDARLTDAFDSIGLEYTDDVKPWVGGQVAFFISSIGPAGGDGGVLIATNDEAATLAALRENQGFEQQQMSPATYRGVDYTVGLDGQEATGVVEGFLVGGTEAAFRQAVDALEGESLADQDRWAQATGGLEEDRVALLYVDPLAFLNGAAAAGGLPPGIFSGAAAQAVPVAIVAYLRPDALVFETSSPATPPGGGFRPPSPGLLPVLPGSAWAAVGVADLGGRLQEFLGAFDQMGIPGFGSAMFAQQLRAQTGLDLQADIVGWMGDAGIFVAGEGVADLTGAIVLASSDVEASTRAVKKLHALLIRQGVDAQPLRVGGTDAGFVVEVPDSPGSLHVAAAADRVIVAFGNDPIEGIVFGKPFLSETDAYEGAVRSLGEGFVATGYIDLERTIAFFESTAGVPDPVYLQDVKPNLDRLAHVVFGSKLDGEIVVQRLVIQVR